MASASMAHETGCPDEAELMVRVGRRDAAAFRTLVDEHALRLRRIAYRMIGDAAEAEDVAQEALLRLWDRAPLWHAEGSGVGAWLTRVAMNLCFDRLRRRRFASPEEVPDRMDEAPAADTAIDAERLRMTTISCIQALSERQRAAIVLTYYEELPNLMAAQAMDLNIKAFESLLVRARQALRTSLVETGLLVGEMEKAS